MKQITQQAQGQLITAVSAGGVEALWRIAERRGPAGELARLSLEQLTAPNSELSALEAVTVVISKFKD